IVLPPLRERKPDIVPMANFLLEQAREKYAIGEIAFSDEALDVLENYKWNGNIREMENKIERAVILTEGNLITSSELDISMTDSVETSDDNQLSEIEKMAVERALAKHNGNITKTADELGLS